jgi:hypothetical protein
MVGRTFSALCPVASSVLKRRKMLSFFSFDRVEEFWFVIRTLSFRLEKAIGALNKTRPLAFKIKHYGYINYRCAPLQIRLQYWVYTVLSALKTGVIQL